MNSSVYHCEDCNKVYKYQKSYLDHMKNHVRQRQELVNEGSVQQQQQYYMREEEMPAQYQPSMSVPMQWQQQSFPAPFPIPTHYHHQQPMPVSYPIQWQYPVPMQYPMPSNYQYHQQMFPHNSVPMQWGQYANPIQYPMPAHYQFNQQMHPQNPVSMDWQQYPEQQQQQQEDYYYYQQDDIGNDDQEMPSYNNEAQDIATISNLNEQPGQYQQHPEEQQHQQGVENGDGNVYPENPAFVNIEDQAIPSTSSSNKKEAEIRKTQENPRYYEITNAFKNNIVTYGIPNKKEEFFFEEFIGENISIFKERLEKSLMDHTIIKFNISIVGEYLKLVGDEMEFTVITHRAKMLLLTIGDDIEASISKQLAEIHNKMSEFQERDSGWTLIRIIRAEINVNRSSLVKGSHWISSPDKLFKRHACINVENSDNYCFKWALISAMDTTKIRAPQRCTSYKIANINADVITLQNNVVLNFSSMKFPLKLSDIKIFETNNNSVSVNVFGYDEETDEIVGPFYITKDEKPKHINLLLLENSEGHHYVFIKNISR